MARTTRIPAEGRTLAISLLRWFDAGHRRLPWRRKRPRLYEVWISEIMLQQTQVAAVVPYFRRWMRLFPTVRALASATEQQVLKAWEGLGSYSRARRLHGAAREMVRDRGSRLPDSCRAWREVPGVGDYTAAAIASMALGEPVAAIDGNVMRVAVRVWGFRACRPTPVLRRRILGRLSDSLARTTRPGDFNQALMELGALVCRPRKPRCGVCPVAPRCAALKRGRQDRPALLRGRRSLPHVDVVAGAIRRGGRLLISLRRADQMLGGLWELPGGKMHPGESPGEALEREILEETGLTVRAGRELCRVRHAYSHFRMTLYVLDAVVLRGRARPIESDAVRWVRPADLRRYPFPAADRRVIGILERPYASWFSGRLPTGIAE